MTVHKLITSRRKQAKTFTKDKYLNQLEQNIKDYKADDSWLNSFADDNKLYVNVNKRYEVVIRMIFAQTESMLASMFDRLPDLIINEGGQLDEEKAQKVMAAYEYLKKVANLEEFANTAAWWYILTGWVSAHSSYIKKGNSTPITDDFGEPMLDEMGEPMEVMTYEFDDPQVSVDNPLYTYFSPESEYSIDAMKVPYYVKDRLMTVDEVLRVYEKQVEPDSTVNSLDDKNNQTNKDEVLEADLARVKTYLYYGHMHPDASDDLQETYGVEYDPDGWYYAVATKEEILHVEKVENNMRTCKLLRWYGVPSEFFGFGLGNILRPHQKEKSIRRTQQARYADVAAFPKLLVPLETDIDEAGVNDPREIPVILYDANLNAPSYLTPPDLSNVLEMTEQKADQDAQMVSGLLDLSQGAQNTNTVDTATGQSIFAEASEKRIRLAKRKFMLFYKEVVIDLLKLAQRYWDEEKLISITDEDGEDVELSVTSDDLADIDFDKDIDMDPDSISVNKDVLRAQAIELYDRAKDDPSAERTELLKDVMRVGFDKKNPNKYIKDNGLQPGMQLIDPMTQQTFIVDESGQVVPQEAMQDLAQPGGGEEVPSDMAGVMGGVQR